MIGEASEFAKFLNEWGWMALFILTSMTLVSVVVWWAKVERPKIAQKFDQKDAEIKALVERYHETLTSNGKTYSKIAARLVDIYQDREGLISANQKVIDQLARGDYKIIIKHEIEEIRGRTGVDMTRILKNGDLE